MARVRYLGWQDRESVRSGHGIVTAGGPSHKKTLTINGQRFVFRGRTGKPSQWRTIEDTEALRYFEAHDEFEVGQ